jgi:hypothetical protein
MNRSPVVLIMVGVVRPQQPARMRPAAQRFAQAPDTVTAAGTVLPVCGQARPPWGRNPASARTLECIRPGPEAPLTDVKDGPVMSTDTPMQLGMIGTAMQAITIRDRAAGVGALSLTEMPYPRAAQNDVIVRVHAAGFTRGELDWPGTWTDRAGHDRAPSVPGHELSGVVAELGYGTTGLTVGQRVFGLTAWTRNGSLAEYAAVEARNLAPLPPDVDHTVAAALPISGLTAWQGLFDHGRLTTGQTVLIHGAAGGVGSIAVQLAREAGAG